MGKTTSTVADASTVSQEEVLRRMEVMFDACRQNGLRMTPQREEIFKEVAQSNIHPDADTIFEKVRRRMPNVSIDTVYRNLTQLEKLGVLSRVDPLCGRARFDANQVEHHHFVCTKCHAIEDIYLSENEKPVLPMSASAHGHVTSMHLQIRGICGRCASKSSQQTQQSANDSADLTIENNKE